MDTRQHLNTNYQAQCMFEEILHFLNNIKNDSHHSQKCKCIVNYIYIQLYCNKTVRLLSSQIKYILFYMHGF